MTDTSVLTSVRELNRTWLAIGPLFASAFRAVERSVKMDGIAVETDIPEEIGVTGDETLLRHAIQHMLQNAVQAMPHGGHLLVTACCDGRSVFLEVADSGPGLNDETRRRIFEPYFTTRQGAAGLGLAVVQRVARAHGGDIVASNCPQGGAAFTLAVPRQATTRAAAA